MITSEREWQVIVTVVTLAVIFGTINCEAVTDSTGLISMCPVESVTDSIFQFRDRNCIVYGGDVVVYTASPGFSGVNEVDEVLLQKALNMVNENSYEYLAVLFYASWCPFSKSFGPSFSLLSALYPLIPHFAVEESSIRPSILSKYGVHGFPTLYLLNSTMRVRYHGSRTVGSLVAFYSDVTGIKTASLDKGSLDKIAHRTNHGKRLDNNDEQENCPFSWARSPENMLRQETYLALACVFVLLRLLYSFYPALFASAQFIWRSLIRNVRLGSFLESPRAYLHRVMQLFSSLKQPCKRSNLQEGAMSAKAWASKSLTTVSIGEASSSRSAPISQRH